MKNTVWCVVTSQLCVTVMLSGCPCKNVPEYSTAVTRTFAINSVILVAIGHILNAIYLNNNASFGVTSGCNGRILLKVHNFPWNHTSTKDANMVVNGK